jgi:Peptidase family M28
MDAQQDIEALAEIGGRGPGTDAERRAANLLKRRLEEAGREAEFEAVDCWPNWPLTYAALAVAAIVGSVLSVSAPIAGAALAFAALLVLFLDGTGLLLTVRRLLGRRASQNVISREGGDKPGILVLVAHYDSGRSGAGFGRGLQERRATFGKLLHRPIGPLEPLFWTMTAVFVCCLLRLPGLEGTLLTAIQFVPTVALILAVPLLVDVALTPAVLGANDNASGVATALRLAERHGGNLEHFDVWVLLTGAQEAVAQGMRGFIKRHRRALERDRTVFVNLDEVGVGTVRYARREGLVLASASHKQLVKLCEEIAEDDEPAGARAIVNRTASDGYAARSAGFPAITITCRNALDYTPDHHRPTDTPERIDPQALERAEGFCHELLRRLDAEIGPDLDRPAEEETLLTESTD